MKEVDYLFLGIAMLIVGYAIPATRNVTVVFGAIVILGILLRFQGTIITQFENLFQAAKGA
jgi:hypothetical protein